MPAVEGDRGVAPDTHAAPETPQRLNAVHVTPEAVPQPGVVDESRLTFGPVAGQEQTVELVIGSPITRDPSAKLNARYDETDAGHGPGTQVTSGAVGRFRLENVCVPEQALNR